MVSFIIATYNGEKYLRETVQSALNQANVDVEIIIIDDGSTDNSYEIAQSLTKFDKRIVSFKNSRNLGFCKTVNKGLKLAKGDYIVILDQDDLLNKNHCQSSLRLFDENTSLVFNDYYLIDSKGKVFNTEPHCIHRDLSLEDFIDGNKIPVPGLVINRKKIIEVGGYPELDKFPNYGEYHTWIRMSNVGKIKFNECSIALYRRHEFNMTNSFDNKQIKRDLARYSLICKRQMLFSTNIQIRKKYKVLISMLRDYKRIFMA